MTLSREPRDAVDNPFVGPRAFRDGETLYGRDRERRLLLDLLIAERIVLLYSPSGAGKTSLIQAELIHRLARRGFRVRPLVRVNRELPVDLLQDGRSPNRYLHSVLASLEEAFAAEEQISPVELVDIPLDDYLRDRRPVAGQGETEILIFDQFEEILTLDPTDGQAKAEFFEAVGKALWDRRRWALFSMREDHLAGLDPYVRPIPTRFANTFRLNLLDVTGARTAMQMPASRAGVTFSDGAVQLLTENLCLVRVQRPDGTTVEQQGPHVEPLQLQVVCYRVWERWREQRPGAVEIDVEDIRALGEVKEFVDNALADYYARQMESVAGRHSVAENVLRRWFDGALITGHGTRGQVSWGSRSTEGIPREAIDALVDVYLLRMEQRRGVDWFELAHDRLIDPIREDNAAWRERNLAPLQRQAARWADQGRRRSDLFRGSDLREGERWAASQARLEPLEQEFLRACQEERSRTRTLRGLGILALFLLLCAIAAGVWAIGQRRESEENRARYMAARARSLSREQYRISLLQSRAALDQAVTPETRGSLLEVLEREPRLVRYLSGHAKGVHAVALSRDGRQMASGDVDGKLLLWDLKTPESAPVELRRDGRAVESLAFSRDGRLLVSGDEVGPDPQTEPGRVTLWDTQTRSALGEPRPVARASVFSVAVSPDGGMLAAGCDWGGLIFCPIEQPVARIGPPSVPRMLRDGRVSSVAFRPDGKLLAVGAGGGKVVLWDVSAGPVLRRVLKVNDRWVRSVAFSPDGKQLVAGYSVPPRALASSGAVGIWDLRFDPPRARTWEIPGDGVEVTGVAFSRNGKVVASSCNDGTIRIWDAESGKSAGECLVGHQGPVYEVSSVSAGSLLAGCSDDGTVSLWDLERRSRLGRLSRVPTEPQSVSAVSPGGRLVATGGETGRITLWDPLTARARGSFSLRSPITSLMFSPDVQTLAVGGEDGGITLFRAPFAGTGHRLPAGHSAAVARLAFSSDGGILASGDADGNLVAWSLPAGAKRAGPVLGHRSYVTGLGFHPLEHRLASVGYDGQLVLWKVESGLQTRRSVSIPMLARLGATSVAFAPDGKTLAVGTDRGALLLWGDAAERWIGFSEMQHRVPVESLAFSEGGTMLASGDQQGRVKLWARVATDAVVFLGSLRSGDSLRVPRLAFADRDRRLLAISDDGIVVVWDLDLKAWKSMAREVAGGVLTPEERRITMPDVW